MIVLDTNVISEVMHPHPNEAVVAWLNQQPGTNLFITSISLAEIGYGLRVLADGQRRRNLRNRFEEFVTQGFEYRVLDFDAAAARVYSEYNGAQKGNWLPDELSRRSNRRNYVDPSFYACNPQY